MKGWGRGFQREGGGAGGTPLPKKVLIPAWPPTKPPSEAPGQGPCWRLGTKCARPSPCRHIPDHALDYGGWVAWTRGRADVARGLAAAVLHVVGASQTVNKRQQVSARVPPGLDLVGGAGLFP